jgi:NADPH2:quinone reductase
MNTTVANAIRCDFPGGPEMMRLVEVDVGHPGPGQALVRHSAVGLNMVDIQFRSGRCQAPASAGLGVEGAGIVVEVGEGVKNVRPGDRITYTGGLETLGAYSTERVMPAAPLIPLPAQIAFDTAAGMTRRGLAAAYLLRRIWPLKRGDTILVHAAAGGLGLILIQWAKLLGLQVIGTVSNISQARLARAYGADEVILYGHEDVAARVRAITGGEGVAVVYDTVGKDTITGSLASLRRRGLLACVGTSSGVFPPVDAMQLGSNGSVFVTRPLLSDYIADPVERDALTRELFTHVISGDIRIEINRRYWLTDAVRAHRDIESRVTTGSSVFVI